MTAFLHEKHMSATRKISRAPKNPYGLPPLRTHLGGLVQKLEMKLFLKAATLLL